MHKRKVCPKVVALVAGHVTSSAILGKHKRRHALATHVVSHTGPLSLKEVVCSHVVVPPESRERRTLWPRAPLGRYLDSSFSLFYTTSRSSRSLAPVKAHHARGNHLPSNDLRCA